MPVWAHAVEPLAARCVYDLRLSGVQVGARAVVIVCELCGARASPTGPDGTKCAVCYRAMIDKVQGGGLDKAEEVSKMISVEEVPLKLEGLSVREAAAMLGVVEATIYLLAKKGDIALIKTTRGLIVPLDVLDVLRNRWKR